MCRKHFRNVRVSSPWSQERTGRNEKSIAISKNTLGIRNDNSNFLYGTGYLGNR